KIQANGLHSLYTQGSEESLSQAASGGEGEAAENEPSGHCADPDGAPTPCEETLEEGDTFLRGAVLGLETRKSSLGIDASIDCRGIQREKMSLYTPGHCCGFAKMIGARQTIRKVFFDFPTLE